MVELVKITNAVPVGYGWGAVAVLGCVAVGLAVALVVCLVNR